MNLSNPEIFRYIKLVIEKRSQFIITALSVMTVMILLAYSVPRQYEAKSTIFIEQNVIEELVRGIAITPSMESRISILHDTILGRSLILNVLKKLDMDSKAENNKQLEEMIVRFQRVTKVSVRNNSLVIVSLKDRDPVFARDYINYLVSEYVENNIFAKREEAYDATEFLERQVGFFKKKMDVGEEAVIKFRQEKGIYLPVDERSLITTIQNYNIEIERIEIERSELEATKKTIEMQLQSENPIVVTMFSENFTNNVGALQNRLKLLLISYTENYPEVIKIKAEIESLKNRPVDSSEYSSGTAESRVSSVNTIYSELRQQLIEIDGKIAAHDAGREKLLGLIKRKESELRKVPEDRKELLDLEQERDSYSNVYARLLERLGQSEVSKQMEVEDKATTFRIIEPAILSHIPSSPNRKILLLAAIAMGFLSGFVLIFVFDYFDDSFKTIYSVKSIGLPILAIIPRIPNFEVLEKKRKQDMLLFSTAGVYMLGVLCVLALEFMELTYFEDFVQGLL